MSGGCVCGSGFVPESCPNLNQKWHDMMLVYTAPFTSGRPAPAPESPRVADSDDMKCRVCGDTLIVGPPITPGSVRSLRCPCITDEWHRLAMSQACNSKASEVVKEVPSAPAPELPRVDAAVMSIASDLTETYYAHHSDNEASGPSGALVFLMEVLESSPFSFPDSLRVELESALRELEGQQATEVDFDSVRRA